MTSATDQVDAHRDELEEETALGLEILVRGAEVGLAVFIGLLVSPPLAILVVVVAVPLLAFALVAGVLAGIVAIPYLLFRTVREHHRTHRSSAVVHGLRRLRARVA